MTNGKDNNLSEILELSRNGHTELKLNVHGFPAVYVIYHVGSNRFYVGSTQNLYQRIRDHLKRLRHGDHKNLAFQKAYTDCQDKKMTVSFIRVDDREQGFDYEQVLLDMHLPSGLLFNRSSDSRLSGKDRYISPEQAKAHSEKLIEFWNTPRGRENKEKHSTEMKNIWSDPERSVKLRKERSSRKKNVGFLKKLAQAGKNVWTNPETRAKTLEAHKKRRRPVLINGVRYDGVGEAAKVLGVPYITIRQRLNRKTPNYHFIDKLEES